MADIDIDKVLSTLKTKYNIEADELKALGFDTDDKIVEYYQQVARASGKLDTSEEDGDKSEGPMPKDNYKLSAEQSKTLKGFQRKEKKSSEAKFAAKAADLSHLPPEERVSMAEAQKEMARLQSAMKVPKRRIRVPGSDQPNP